LVSSQFVRRGLWKRGRTRSSRSGWMRVGHS